MMAPLPTERDFDPSGCGLDEQHAWKDFGGLTLADAIKKFRENPLHYQEDFMWMGGKAFAFYFPVIDSYLRTIPDPGYDEWEAACILAHCIEQQFDAEQFHSENLRQVRHLAPCVLDLAEHVLKNIHLYAPNDPEEQRRIASAWQTLKDHVSEVGTK